MRVKAALPAIAALFLNPCHADPEEHLAGAMQEALRAASGPAAAGPVRKLHSVETADSMSSEVHGLIDASIETLRTALAQPAQWCAMLLLHVNNKECTTNSRAGRTTLQLKVVRRFDQPVDQAFEIDFDLKASESSPRGFAAQLAAPTGPMSTTDYLIVLEAIPAPGGRTFARLAYSYRQGAWTSVAMRMYFSTMGRGKVGFTEVRRAPDGQPEYIGGPRGLIERNAMRYFLALEALLSADKPMERAGRWFELTEHYPRQLREATREQYMSSRPFK